MKLVPFDKREGKIWFNGEYVEWADAKVHILSHGLNYGSSVFEGVRIYNGKGFKLKEHLERFGNSARTLGMKLGYTIDEMLEATANLIEQNNLARGYIRPIAWRGPESMLIGGGECKINVAIAAWLVFEDNRDEVRKLGVKLCISDWRKPAPNASPYFTKAASIYTLSTMIKNEAVAKGFDDALILDGDGNVAEASTSNFFAIFGDELHTSVPDCFLDGITRQTVIQIARVNGITVVERKISPSELQIADAAFLTGTAIEIMPIAAITNYSFDVKNPLITRITNLFHDYVRYNN